MQSADFLVNSPLIDTPLSKEHVSWTHDDFVPLKEVESSRGWGYRGAPRIQMHDTTLCSDEKMERSLNRLDSIDYDINGASLCNSIHNTKSYNGDGSEREIKHEKSRIVPKLAVSQREIRGGEPSSQQPKAKIEIKNAMEDGEYDTKNNPERIEAIKMKEIDTRPLSARERLQRRQRLNHSRSFRVKNRRNLSSRQLFQHEDGRSRDLPKSRNRDHIGTDDEDKTRNEDTSISESFLVEDTDTPFAFRRSMASSERQRRMYSSRTNSIPRDIVVNSPSDADSDDMTGSAIKYSGSERCTRQSSSRRLTMTPKKCASTEQEEGSEERTNSHRSSKSKRSSLHGSNRKSGQSRRLRKNGASSPMEELEALINSTVPRSVDGISRRRERRATLSCATNHTRSTSRRTSVLSGRTNHTKSERPRRSSTMSGHTNHTKSEQTGRRASMSGGTKQNKSERKCRRASMSGGTNHKRLDHRSRRSSMDGVKTKTNSNLNSRRVSMSGGIITGVGDATRRPKSANCMKKAPRRSSDIGPRRPQSLIDLVILVDHESSTLSTESDSTTSSHSSLSCSLNSREECRWLEQVNDDKGPRKCRPDRSQNKRRGIRVSGSFQKTTNDCRISKELADNNTIFFKGTESKHTRSRRRTIGLA